MRYMLFSMALCLGAVLLALLVEPCTPNPRVDEIQEATHFIARAAYGSQLSGRTTDGDVRLEDVFPVIEGSQIVLRSSTLVTAHASISLPKWLDPSAMQDALDMVTEQGLFERTVDWWDQPDFLALTGDELAKLVPECAELGYSFGGNKTIADFIGGLPSYDDCARAFADVEVQRTLASVAMLEIPINSLGLTPLDKRTPQWTSEFEALIASMHTRELDLAREMERASGYAHWSILQRAFVAWNQ